MDSKTFNIKPSDPPVLRKVALGGKIAAKAVSIVIEKTIMNFFIPFPPEYLQAAIDQQITLLDFIALLNAQYDTLTENNQKILQAIKAALGMSRQIIPRFPREQILEYLNFKYALPWVIERKPEFKPILTTLKGAKFFKKQIRQFQKYFGLVT